MSISRRQFLASASLSLAASAAVSRAMPIAENHASSKLDDWSAVRNQFNLSREYINLCASFFIASHPRPVREAIERYRRAIDENPFLVVHRGMFGSEDDNLPRKAREAAAAYVGGNPQEIALTGSTTMGLALVYSGLSLKAGQEILTTRHDFYSHHEAIRLAAEKAGASVRKIALFERLDTVSEETIVERIRRAVRPGTRAVGITWVHSNTGLKLPIRRIAEAIKQANRGRAEDRVLLIVDGVHGFGVEDESVAELGCDFFVSGTHKWIFAPRGTGIIWAPEPAWGMLRPTIPSFTADEIFQAWMEGRAPQGPTRASWVSPGGFHDFEHQWAMVEAFQFHRSIGRKRIAERIHALNEQCKESLARMRHIKLYTPRESTLSAGLICFDVQGMRPKAVVKRLLERNIIASTTPYGVSYARIAPSLVNTPEEIETALREIHALSTA
ncbi:MAG: aminotransferase class V-fold PLP-dependent enzyme [Gammaproteobacteria bacterium]